jgi:hypothetical protein
MPPKAIMLIRHAEKPEKPPPYGVTEKGKRDPDSLCVLGWQRAGALVPFFASPSTAGIVVPKLIYAANVTKDTSFGEDAQSHRPIETLTPLSRALADSAEFITSFNLGEETAVAEDILQRDDPVLVAWEHKRIPLIATALGAKVPGQWPAHRFDIVWLLALAPNGTYNFTQVNQSLLSGDQ